jgi:hypothetical protein
MAQSQNTHNKDIFDGTLVFATDQSGVHGVNQGDIAVFDSTLNSSKGGVRAVVPATGQGEMAHYVGIATQNSVLNSLNDVLLTVVIAFKNVFNLKTTASDVYTHLLPVYWNETADAQTVTVSTNSGARTIPVGYVVIPQEYLMNGNLSITGAAGILIPVAIVAHQPVASLA